MKISVLRNNLAAALATVMPAVASQSTLPILGNVLLVAAHHTLTLSAMNLEIAISTSIGAMVDEPGAVTLPARLLAELVKTMPEARIDIDLKVSTMIAHFQCDRINARVKGINPDEFPLLPAIAAPGGAIPAAKLLGLINSIVFAASKDASRPILAAVEVVVSHDALTMTAIDGWQLATAVTTLTVAADDFKALVPGAALATVARIFAPLAAGADADADVQIELRPGQIYFRLGNTVVVSQLVEGNYPNHAQILAAARNNGAVTTLTVAADALTRALKVTGLFTENESRRATLTATPDLLTLASTNAYGNQESSIDAVGDAGITFACNSTYLARAVNAASAADLTLTFTRPEKPLVLTAAGDPGAWTYLLMPMAAK